LEDYNNQINTYQTNISDIILLLRESQTNIYGRTVLNPNQGRNNVLFSENNGINDIYRINRSMNIPNTRRRQQQQQRYIIRQNFLSQTQINTATRIIPYTARLSVIDTKCPISLNDFVINENICQIIHCSHIFNPAEINRWFIGNNVCPVCRYDLRTYRNEELIEEVNRETPFEQDMVETDVSEVQNTRTTQRSLEERLVNTFRALNQNSRVPLESIIFEIPMYMNDISNNDI
jgi:hypothetical protein